MSDLVLTRTTADQLAFRELLRNVPASYRYGAERFVGFLETRGLGLEDGIRAYAAELSKPHQGHRFAAQTVNHYLSAAKNRIRVALDQAKYRLPFAEVQQVKATLADIKGKKVNTHGIGPDKVLSTDEIAAFLAKIPAGKGWLSLMFEFLAETGVRVSEMLGVLLSDLAERGDHYEVRILGKGQKERTVYAPKDLIERVRGHFRGTWYLFESPYRDRQTGGPAPYKRSVVSQNLRRQGQAILGRTFSAHTLRHTWATHYIARTGDVKGAQLNLGHSSAQVTMDLYCHSSFDWTKARAFSLVRGSATSGIE